MERDLVDRHFHWNKRMARRRNFIISVCSMFVLAVMFAGAAVFSTGPTTTHEIRQHIFRQMTCRQAKAVKREYMQACISGFNQISGRLKGNEPGLIAGEIAEKECHKRYKAFLTENNLPLERFLFPDCRKKQNA